MPERLSVDDVSRFEPALHAAKQDVVNVPNDIIDQSDVVFLEHLLAVFSHPAADQNIDLMEGEQGC